MGLHLKESGGDVGEGPGGGECGITRGGEW